MQNFCSFTYQIFKSKTIYRILFNWLVRDKCARISGIIVDIAGGSSASYYDYLPKNIEIIKTNRYMDKGVDKVVDFEAVLPFESNSVDIILFFNALYIIKQPEHTIKELHRILKPGGQLFIASPFIASEMKEPHDYRRMTYEGIECMLDTAGFSSREVIRFGERYTSAAYLLHSFFIFNIVRLFVYAIALLLDKCIPHKITHAHPAPLGYFCVVKK